MASFFVLDSSELKMMVERIKRGRNDKMWRVLFGCRSLGNDLRTTFFSFRCRSGVKGRRREEEPAFQFFSWFVQIEIYVRGADLRCFVAGQICRKFTHFSSVKFSWLKICECKKMTNIRYGYRYKDNGNIHSDPSIKSYIGQLRNLLYLS